MTEPNEIATLPPLEELQPGVARSPRTGEPRRPAVLGVAAVVLYLAAAAVAVAYGIHWWEAAHPETYPASARLVDWVDPDPGKWLSLTLEGVLSAAAVIAAPSGDWGLNTSIVVSVTPTSSREPSRNVSESSGSSS